MSIINRLLGTSPRLDISGLAAARDGALVTLEAGREELASLEAELRDLQLKPVPVEDAAGRITATVAQSAANWRRTSTFRHVDGRRHRVPQLGFPDARQRAAHVELPDAQALWDLIAAGAPDLAERILRGALAAELDGRETIPAAGRAKRQAELEARIAELQTADAEAVEMLATVGVNVAHLPAEVRRREDAEHDLRTRLATPEQQQDVDTAHAQRLAQTPLVGA